MKPWRILLTSLFAILLCSIDAESQISGDGEVVKEEIELPSFTGIGLSFSGKVILAQGSPQKVILEGQKNVLDNIKREVKNNTWRIEYKEKVKNSKDVTIYITVPTLEEVMLSGSGDISTTNRFKDLGDLEVSVAGSGDVSLDFDAREVELALSGSGDVRFAGSADAIEVAISGSGDVDAQDLRTKVCEIAISGSGDATVYCTEELEAAVSGSGDIGYKGNAPKVEVAVRGSGDVREID